MANKMLIDATHPEETRVVVVRENRVEEFDYESASKKQLRGNIYLAKVTRVEPSLQAAFVNYGGNRHGFLPFNEIHPDYYHLPLAERQALKQEEQRASRAAQARGHREDRKGKGSRGERGAKPPAAGGATVEEEETENLASMESTDSVTLNEAALDNNGEGETIALEAALPPTKYSGDLYAPSDANTEDDDDSASDQGGHGHEFHDHDSHDGDADTADFRGDSDDDDDEDDGVEVINDDGEGPPPAERKSSGGEDRAPGGNVESIGSEDALEELPDRIRRRRRNYKIQEVIKRGQILLVQVVKEERGNKGAALTTYLSLAGRYTVLMPNTGSGGGISRKISSPADRKRLREIANELDVSEGMGLIIRTAGASRTKSEIKRDYEYLLRLWENVRELTLKSSAPCLVYEEGDLIKRSIRDLYNRDIDEVLVAGEEAYRDAKDFMRMLMPSHAKNVQLYKDPEPVFIAYEVERQLNAMFSPQVTLPSGGYIVLNQTEALVSIDVNSGKSTREFSIEETALKTNLEASEEIARQLRLRDLAGLIVVDFIDMEEKRNNRSVERKLKECLRNDRARIQVGRISHFGLLEMSRQRLRTGMIEGSTCSCPTCQGTGFVRSTESVALSVLRGLEDWLRTNQPCNLNAVTSTEVALYILNQKRDYLHDIEGRYGVAISISANDRVHGGSFLLEKLSPAVAPPPSVSKAVRQADWTEEPVDEEEETERTERTERTTSDTSSGDEEADDGRRSRRRRRRRRGRGENGLELNETLNGSAPVAPWQSDAQPAGDADADADAEDDDEGEALQGDAERSEGDEAGAAQRRRSRRRGRRGGRHQRARQGREAGAPGEDGDSVQDGDNVQDGDSPQAGVPAADLPELRAGDKPAAAFEHVAAPAPEPTAAEPAAASEPVVTPEPAAPEPVATPEPAAPEPVAASVEAPAAEVPAPEPHAYEPPALEALATAPLPAAEPAPALELSEPGVKERRGTYLNGNGAHPPAASPAVEQAATGEEPVKAETQQGDTAIATEPKERGTRRGWWQRRGGPA